MELFTLILNLLVMVSQAYPKISPAIADIIKSFKPGDVPDITQEEFERRIDAAIAKLQPWE